MQCDFSLHTILSDKVTAKKAKTQQIKAFSNKKRPTPLPSGSHRTRYLSRSADIHISRNPHPPVICVVFFQIPPLFVLQIENFHYLCTVEKGAYPKGRRATPSKVDAPTCTSVLFGVFSGPFFDNTSKQKRFN